MILLLLPQLLSQLKSTKILIFYDECCLSLLKNNQLTFFFLLNILYKIINRIINMMKNTHIPMKLVLINPSCFASSRVYTFRFTFLVSLNSLLFESVYSRAITNCGFLTLEIIRNSSVSKSSMSTSPTYNDFGDKIS